MSSNSHEVEQDLYELPGTWEWVALGNICNPINGRAFKSSEWCDSGVPIIRIQNLKSADAAFNYFQGGLDGKHKVVAGDLLFAWSGTPGTSFGAHIWHGPDAALNQHIFNVKFDQGAIDPKYFCYALNQNVTRYVEQAQGGVGLAHITKGKFIASKIPLAPMDQQKLIVAEIEKQFSRLDEAVANLKRVKANLKRYKAAVLKAAVEGKLTEEWRKQHPDIEPADKLLERILAERREKWQGRGKYKEPVAPDTTDLPELPKGWVWASAEQLCEFITKGTTPKAPKLHNGEGDIRFLKVYNLTFSGDLNYNYKPVFVDNEVHQNELSRSKVFSGDVLINIVGPPLGQVSVVPPEITEANINQAIARFRPLNGVLYKFVASALMSTSVMSWATKRAKTTAGQSNLTLALCRELPIPLAPTAEQEQVIEEVERFLSVASEIDSQIEVSLCRASRLRQSILKQAFTGGILC